MAYVALYRKWRPGTFRELVGQEHIARTLSNAIVSGRIGHAYLFAGPRGTGKTSTAKIFAKALNCEKGPTPEPCNVCDNCCKINAGSSMDVFEIDAASNRGIDEIRDLRETVKFAPVDGRYKVYIIDEVHMLTAEAFNALLKTLEEPPAHVVFILATTEVHKVPATIQSRCQRYDFRRITVDDIRQRLELVTQDMKVAAEPEALALIAVQADGGMRDALSILDQCISLAEEDGVTVERVQQILGLIGHKWIWQLTAAIAKPDMEKVLAVVSELVKDGKDLKQVIGELALHLRSLMVYQAAGTMEGLDLYSESEDILTEQARFFSREQVMWMLKHLHETMNELRWSPQPRVTVEAALLALCEKDDLPVMHDLSERAAVTTDKTSKPAGNESVRIQQLEAKLAQLAAIVRQGTPAVPGRSEDTAGRPVPKVQTAPTPLRQPVVPAVATTEAPVAVTADGTKLWQGLLTRLQGSGKAFIYACVSKGEFRGMNGTQFFISFKGSKFLKERTEKDDYRGVLESILADLAGKPLRVICALDEPTPPPPPPPKPKKKSLLDELPPLPPEEHVDIAALPPENQQVMQAAVEAFGDHFVVPDDSEVPDDKDEAPLPDPPPEDG